MRILRTLLITSLAVSFILTLEVPKSSSATLPKADREEIYQRFGEILETTYDGLGETDFHTTRQNAAELVRRGKAVVRFGGREAPEDMHGEVARALRDLNRALRSFDGAARKGGDVQLKRSLTSVRESWDGLATLYAGGCRLPPIVSVNCPADTLAGEQAEIFASASNPEMKALLFTWTLSEGQIAKGQGTSKIVIPTIGLGGKTIKVEAEVNDGSGLTSVSTCTFKVLNP